MKKMLRFILLLVVLLGIAAAAGMWKVRQLADSKLLIKEDEDAIYHLLDVGMEEFRLVGQVYISESLKQWKVAPSPKVSVGVGCPRGGLSCLWTWGTCRMKNCPKSWPPTARRKSITG